MIVKALIKAMETKFRSFPNWRLIASHNMFRPVEMNEKVHMHTHHCTMVVFY